MKNVIFFLLLLLSSCASYYDDYGHVVYKEYSFKFNSNYNTYRVLERMPTIADTEISYLQKFEINLPKKIKKHMISGGNYIFEFNHNQIIVINAGYSNYNKKSDIWILKNSDIYESYAFLNGYWKDKDYEKMIIYKADSKNAAKIYTNGEVKILLFNIRNDDFDDYLQTIKSFKYLE